MNGGVLLGARLANRLKDMALRPLNPAGPRAPNTEAGIELHPVQITSTTQTDGRYPGTLYLRDVATDDFTQLGDAAAIRVTTPNGESLTTGTYYWAKLVGTDSDGRPVYEAVGTFAAASSFSGASVWLNSSQTVAVGQTTIQWTHQAWDTDDYWDIGAPDRLVIRQSGDYVVMAGVTWSGSGTNGMVGSRTLILRGVGDILQEVNGQARAVVSVPAASIDASGNPQSAGASQFVAMEVRVVSTPVGAGTYVYAVVDQDSGSNRTIGGLSTDYRTWMTIRKR